MTGLQTDPAEEKLKIPLDLTEWCPKETLLAWIKEEIEALNWSNPELLAHLSAHPKSVGFSLRTTCYPTAEG